MRASFLYLRFQDKREYDRLIDCVLKYAKECRIKISNRSHDNALSGMKRFELLRRCSEGGLVGVVVIPNKRTLGDDEFTIEDNYYSLRSYGTDVRMASEELMLNMPRRFLNAIKSYNAKGIEWIVRLGECNKPEPCTSVKGSPPYGYHATENTLTVDEEESRLVRTAFEMFSEGVSTSDIAAELTRRSPNGKRFIRTSVAAMLDNVKYCGVVASSNCMIPAIVPNRLWLIVSGIRQKNRAFCAYKHSFLLENVNVYAFLNGTRLKVIGAGCMDSKSGNIEPIYLFNVRKEHYCVPAEQLESDVIGRVREWACRNSESYINLICDYSVSRYDEMQALIREYRRELSEIERKISHLVSMTENDISPDVHPLSEFDEAKTRYLNIIKKLCRAEIECELCSQGREDIEFFFGRLVRFDELGRAEQMFIMHYIIYSVRLMLRERIAVLRFCDDSTREIPIQLKRPTGRLVEMEPIMGKKRTSQ